MQFLKLASLFSIAALAGASSVTFQSLDDTDRTVYFTANAGMEAPGPVSVPGGQTVKVELSYVWAGNWYSVCDGEENVPGMLGEVSLNSWNGVSFFDVSAIVNPGDTKGVHLLYPADEPNTPVSGCDVFPCTNAYYFPDDLQTKGATTSDLICTLGNNSPVDARDLERPESASFPRSFVERRW